MNLFLFIIILFSISVLMRFVVNFFLSKRGWGDLALNYKTDNEDLEYKVPLASIGLNKILYKNSVVMSYNDKGLHLRLLFIFKMFHDPLFIPWGDFRDIYMDNSIFGKRYKIIIGDPEIAYIIINESLYSNLDKYINKERW